MTLRFIPGSSFAFRRSVILLVLLNTACTGLPAASAIGEARAAAVSGNDRTVELEVLVRVRRLPQEAEGWTAWIPVPRSDDWQLVRDLRMDGRHELNIVQDEVYGNRFLRVHGRVTPGVEPTLRALATVTRRAVRPADFEGRGAGDAADARYLAPDRLVPVDGPIAEESARVVPVAAPPLDAARRLYEHVASTLRYDKSGIGWGRGDALRACNVRTGNCTDFHSLFIGLSRARGLPARFVMGVPLPADAKEGEVPGYHCWAEFYTPEGWRPVDASEANKRPELAGELFSGLDADRVAFTVGRDIPLPGAAAGPLNYVIWPHVEVDGRVHEAVETSIRFREAQSGPSLGQAAGPDQGPRRP